MASILYSDHHYMQRALELASKGRAKVSPNPMVGCVIVKNKKIIAEGYHKKFGGAHAEVNALRALKSKAFGSTLYVTLEPCHHHGKTPPCVEAVIKSGAKRVVIAMTDPNPLTKGKSIRKLRAAGVAVTVGVCRAEAFELNRYFVTAMQKQRPYVICKIAQSLDGKISTRKGKQGWITGAAAKDYVQKLRGEVDAVLVGRGTLQIDNPRLNVRDKFKKQPRRVILDSKLSLDLNSKILKTHGGDVIIACTLKSTHPKVLRLQKMGVTVLNFSKASKHKIPLMQVLRRLQGLGINALLVEGGQGIFTSFMSSNCVDEWQFIMAPQIVGDKGLMALRGELSSRFNFKKMSMLGADLLMIAQV